MRKSRLTLVLGCAVLLGGCNPTTVGLAASPLFVPDNRVNLLNTSYAAADTLSVQTKQRVPTSSSVAFLPFEEIVDRSKEKVITNPNLGIMISDQIQSRFLQLGYSVVENGGKANVSGIYEVVGNKLAVRLRMKDARTGALYGQYDYWMPITGEVRRYMNPNGGGIPIYKMREGLDGMIDR